MRDFTAMLRLSDHMINTEKDIPYNADWNEVERLLSDEIMHSKAYIDKVLNGGGR